MTPKEVINGTDPQLKKAVDVIMKQLEDKEKKEVTKPEPPVRAK